MTKKNRTFFEKLYIFDKNRVPGVFLSTSKVYEVVLKKSFLVYYNDYLLPISTFFLY